MPPLDVPPGADRQLPLATLMGLSSADTGRGDRQIRTSWLFCKTHQIFRNL